MLARAAEDAVVRRSAGQKEELMFRKYDVVSVAKRLHECATPGWWFTLRHEPGTVVGCKSCGKHWKLRYSGYVGTKYWERVSI